MTYYVNSSQKTASHLLAECLSERILQYRKPLQETVFLCVGTDRLTGDCLGPYVGRKLHQLLRRFSGISVYGTLSEPVHALNLDRTCMFITQYHPDALIIAIDACLGSKKHLGYVTIGDGALYPGAGIHKKLTAVGNLHITGIVNTGGFLEQWMLQTTPLSTVITLADVITAGIGQVAADGILSNGNF